MKPKLIQISTVIHKYFQFLVELFFLDESTLLQISETYKISFLIKFILIY